MNKKTLFQNITAIFGVVGIISLVLPYYVISASASAAGSSGEASETVNGISFITDGGAWGYIFVICLAAILVFNFLKQLEQFKKLVNIIGSGLMILSLFSAPSAMSVMGGQSESVSVNISVGHGIGFWLALICSLGIAGVAIVNFLNLQGNPVFDAVNTSADGEGSGTSAQSIDFSGAAERVTDAAKSLAGSVSKQVGNLTEKAQAAAAAAAEQKASAPSVQSAPTSAPQKTAKAAPAAAVEDSDLIMEKISKLFDMKEKGILTEQEFNEKKSELLKKM